MTNHLIRKITELNLYPVSVHQTRYGGVYEGSDALWFAVSGDLPESAVGDDFECIDFWMSDASLLVGRGKTPNEALVNLIQRVKNPEARSLPHFRVGDPEFVANLQEGFKRGNRQ